MDVDTLSKLKKLERRHLDVVVTSWGYGLLGNLKCSKFRKISWEISSVVMVFFPPGKSYVILWNFEKALLEILIQYILPLLENLYVFLYHFWFS